jgi:hypothetical protein
MPIDPANASELKEIAAEIGAEVLEGALRYPSETGGWQLGELDLSEYLDRYRNQRLVIIIAPAGQADAPTYTCGICGFVMNEAGECPRCRMQIADAVGRPARSSDILEQVEALLSGDDSGN